MKPKHLMLALALAAAACLAAFGDKRPSNEQDGIAPQATVPVTEKNREFYETKTVADKTSRSNEGPDYHLISLIDRQSLIGRNEDGSSPLFIQHSWTPPPPVPQPMPLEAPMAPPLPFKFLGKSKEGGKWQVFLTRDDDTFIVRENESIEDKYRVVDIHPPTMTLIFLPLNQTQSLTIE